MAIPVTSSSYRFTASAWDIRKIDGVHDEGIMIAVNEQGTGRTFDLTLSLNDLNLLLRIEEYAFTPPVEKRHRLRGIRA